MRFKSALVIFNFFIIIFVIVNCREETENPPDEQNVRRGVDIEYDYQYLDYNNDYNIFKWYYWGKIQEAFDEANTTINIWQDETQILPNTPETRVQFMELWRKWYLFEPEGSADWITLDTLGAMYLMGIIDVGPNLRERNGGFIPDGALAITLGGGRPYECPSIIFVGFAYDTLLESYGWDKATIGRVLATNVTIHELGHQRSALSDEPIGSNCVMRPDIPVNNNEFDTTKWRFLNNYYQNCLDIIKSTDWEEGDNP